MQAAISLFEGNMVRVRDLHSLQIALSKQVTAAVDLTDILRSEVVLAVSALDHFVHELTRLGMLECWSGLRTETPAFKRFQLPIAVAKGITTNAIDTEIRARHGYVTFQHPDKIAEAVRLFSEASLWEEVARELGQPAQAVKMALILTVDRRNKIAHEADADPSYPGQRWPIDNQLVESIFDQIELIVRAIFKVAV